MNTKASPARVYILNRVALLGLLALTIAASFLNLGVLNSIVAASISVFSTALILLFYMHVRRSKPLLWVSSVPVSFGLELCLFSHSAIS